MSEQRENVSQTLVVEFDNLVRPSDTPFEAMSKISATVSDPFVNENAVGGLRQVDSLDLVGEIASKSGENLKNALAS